jgi:uncharacterized protein (TIGR00255 family)
MIGYGAGRSRSRNGTVDVEVRSVNGRFLDVRCTLPKEFSFFEPLVRDCVQEFVARGQINVYLDVAFSTSGQRLLVNEPLAAQLTSELRQVAKRLRLDPQLSLQTLALIPGVIATHDASKDARLLQPVFLKALRQALRCLVRTRAAEGLALAADIRPRIAHVRTELAAIQRLAPNVVQRYQARLRQRLAAVQRDGKLPFDSVRVLTELGIFSERVDITEEITRASCHLKHLKEALTSGGVVGKRLDFLLQELFRETSTIGNKANCADISRHCVAIKEELEKIREQVQNIE